MQGLQIWVNLPKKDKNVKPGYQHIAKDKIPTIHIEEKNLNIKILVGKVLGQSSSVNTYSPVSIFDINFTKPNDFNISIPSEQIAMIYVIKGEIKFKDNNNFAKKGQMIYFDQSANNIQIDSLSQQGSYLVLAGKPLNEPIARHGPFVANTEGEIKQAVIDYQKGKMGNIF